MLTRRGTRLSVKALLASVVLVIALTLACSDSDGVRPRLSLSFEGIRDTDEMCIWIHPTDRSLSTILAVDKDARCIIVYDLSGDVLQTMPLPETKAGSERPGSIDLRYGFRLENQPIDIVAFNQQACYAGCGIYIYRIDPETRLLAERVDDGNITTRSDYGLGLYESPLDSKYYAFVTSKTDGVEQYELFDNGEGRISGALVRCWDQKQCEGVVADDELGYVYISEESSGIWRYKAEPDAPNTGTLIAAVGENNFAADAEGVTVYYAVDGAGYIIVSSQGNSSFLVYDRRPPHQYVKAFTVKGARKTDGIDVTNVDLGPAFPHGIFVCHANGNPAITMVVAYEDLDLMIDSSYDPRGQ